ncbi:MAG: MMPL family transporter [Blastocatellia bacterium]|nr:MMPL family transporter [Blastocatellia bacterium]
MDKPGNFAVSHSKLVIALVLAVTTLLAAIIIARGISFDGSPETLTRKDSALDFFNEIRSTFGDDRVIIVALTTSDVFTKEFIAKLDRLTLRLASVPGVADSLSLTNIKSIRRDGQTLLVEKLIPRSADGERLRRLKEEVTRDPFYVKQYISADGRTAAITVFLKSADEAAIRAITEEVERIAKSEAAGDEVLLAGIPVIDARAVDLMVRDMVLLSPISALLCFLVFVFSFRSFWGGVLPMVALVIGLIWTIGLMRLLGYHITFATLSLPTTLMAVGSSYLFHMLNQYRISMARAGQRADGAARRAAWLDGLKFISPAVIVSGTTTMAGFGSLASSPVSTVREMGIFEALGVMFMLILSLTFIPAVLALLPAQSFVRTGPQEKDYATWLNDLLRHITAWILFRRRRVFIISIAITSFAGAGAIWLRVNTDYLRIFPQSSDTVQWAEKLHERLSGAATVQVVVSGAPQAVVDPDFLRQTDSLEKFAARQEGVDAVFSITDVVKRLNSLLGPSPRGVEELPVDRAQLASIFDDYLSQDENISRLVNQDRSRAVIILRTNLFDSNKLKELTNKIDEWSSANLSGAVTARVTGSIVLLNDASDAVAASQKTSLALALVMIYMMMALLFRSFATGFLALTPNLLPIVCYFGFLGWMGFTLDITTSLVASSVLGLAVDNSVHMIRRYRQSASEHDPSSEESEGWVMWLTVLRTGKPMVLANLMLMAAFLIFMLSSFIPVRIAGTLWAVTIFACLAADLIFLPVLMKSGAFARIALGNGGPTVKQLSESPHTSVPETSDIEL